jgi:hypothetical protein
MKEKRLGTIVRHWATVAAPQKRPPCLRPLAPLLLLAPAPPESVWTYSALSGSRGSGRAPTGRTSRGSPTGNSRPRCTNSRHGSRGSGPHRTLRCPIPKHCHACPVSPKHLVAYAQPPQKGRMATSDSNRPTTARQFHSTNPRYFPRGWRIPIPPLH